MTADTIGFRLTINLVSPIEFKETLIPAGDRFAPTIPYDLFIWGAQKVPTIEYALTIQDVGVPEILYTTTISDMHFVFSGMPPVCDVSSAFVITGKPNPANQPSAPSSPVQGPGIPMLQMLGGAGGMSFGKLVPVIQSLQQVVYMLMGQANQQTQKPSNFTEVRGARVTSQHRIFNPSDNSQFVDITQIDALTFKNKTGQTITWSR